MKLIKTALCFVPVIIAVIVLIPIGIVVVIGSLIGFRKPLSVLMYRIAQGWARAMIALTGCRVTVRGRERVPRSGGVCFVSNHGSIYDILLALAYIGRPFGFIAKKELLYVPLLDLWISILGGLFIDRRNPRKALATINEGIRRLKAGGGMLIFPEGHRSRGQGLLPFRSGAFKMASQSGVPIVPIAIVGSYEIFEKEGRLRLGPVGITFGETITPAGGPRQELTERVRAVIEAGLAGERD